MAWSSWIIDSGKNECDIWIQNLKLYQILTAVAYAAKQFVLKFGFSDKATKFEKIFIILLQERHVLCAQQRTCQTIN